PVFAGEWTANVVKDLDALETSCIVIPCSFTHPKEKLPSSRLRGIWHLKVVSINLSIMKIRPGSWKTSGVAQTNPKEPSLVQQETATEGHPYTVTCSVIHTCPSHVPKLTWSGSATGKHTESHRQLHNGHWEIQSILTIIPEEKDDHSVVTCTAKFHGGKTSAASVKLYIKRGVNYKLIIIPTAVGIGHALLNSNVKRAPCGTDCPDCLADNRRMGRAYLKFNNNDGNVSCVSLFS
ncbi:hypothetical protein INR49_024230, partial [Caranx melampygus]